MQELLNKLQNEHGLSPEQSSGILNTVANFIKEKVPMAAGMIDTYFPQGGTGTSNSDGTSNQNESTLGKLEDLAKSKLGGMFGKQ